MMSTPEFAPGLLEPIGNIPPSPGIPVFGGGAINFTSGGSFTFGPDGH